MSTYTFNVQIVVPQAWSLLLFFLAQLVLFYGGPRFVHVFRLCINHFPIMPRWVRGKSSEIEQASKIETVNEEVKIEERRLRKRTMFTYIFYALIVVLILFFLSGLVHIYMLCNIKNEKVKIEEPRLPKQAMSTYTFYVQIVVLLFFLGGLVVSFRERLVNIYIACTNYFHIMSRWVGGRLVNIIMLCNNYIHIMGRWFGGGRLVNIYMLCTKYFHIMCRWVGQLLKLIKGLIDFVRCSITSPGEKEPENEEDLNELNVDPHDVVPLKNYIQSVIESLESLNDKIQPQLSAELEDLKKLVVNPPVDGIPGPLTLFIQKSIESLESLHDKLHQSL